MNDVDMQARFKRAAEDLTVGPPPTRLALSGAVRASRRTRGLRLASVATGLAMAGAGVLGIQMTFGPEEERIEAITAGQPSDVTYALSVKCPPGANSASMDSDYFVEPAHKFKTVSALAETYLAPDETFEEDRENDDTARVRLVRPDGTVRAELGLKYYPTWETWVELSARWCDGEALDASSS